jgi:predicted dehydrogenase
MSMRIGLIGLGRAGTIHLEAARLVESAELVAVADPALEARRRARDLGIHAYANPHAMLERAKLDAVIICAPPADHADLAIASLERGVHVLCEKPLALTTWDALSMLRTASRKHLQLVLATKFRHVPALATARDLIASGKLGEPVLFEVSFCSPVDMSQRWNADRRRAGGGVIIDNGCHAIDLVSFLFGSVSRVQATLHRPLQHLAVEDGATIHLGAGDGAIGRADVSWSLSTERDSYVTVHGSKGTIEVGWRTSRMKLRGEDWVEIGGPYDKIDAHRRMITAFVETAATGGASAPWITTVECLRTVAAVAAAYRSLHSGGWEWIDMKGMRERRANGRANGRAHGGLQKHA